MVTNRLTIGCLGFALLAVPAQAVGAERPAPAPDEVKPAETVNSTAFEKEANQLWRCRYDVATKLRKDPMKVRVGSVLVRFTVTTQGIPTGTVVVAEQPTDSDVLSCVKTAVEKWRMLPGPASELNVEKRVALGTMVPDEGTRADKATAAKVTE